MGRHYHADKWIAELREIANDQNGTILRDAGWTGQSYGYGVYARGSYYKREVIQGTVCVVVYHMQNVEDTYTSGWICKHITYLTLADLEAFVALATAES